MPLSSTMMLPHLLSLRSGQVAVSSGLARVPMATTTTSQGMTNSEPGMTIGPGAAGGVGLAQLHADALEAGDPFLLVAEHFDRRDQELELDAFLLGVVDFLGAGRHFLAGAAIDDHGGLGAQAFGGAGGVHGDVAAADDGDALALEHRGVGPRELVGGHQVHAGEILVGGIDALEVLARHIHEDRQAGAVGDEDGVELLAQFRQGVGAADDDVADDLHARPVRAGATSSSTIFLGRRNSGMP